MSALDTCTDSSTMTIVMERVRYFARQLITADDMRAEQDYFRQKLHRHNRYLHGWGVVCGCEVTSNPNADHPWQVSISAGYLITPHGDEVLIGDSVDFDLAGDWRQAFDPCAHAAPCLPVGGVGLATVSKPIYLAACYVECNSRPVRMQPAGCGCDDASCEYSRIRESFVLARLTDSELPQSHTMWKANGAKPGCPDWPNDDCVVLAKITLPSKREIEIDGSKIDSTERRVLII